MALFEDESIEDWEEMEEANAYLDDPQKGMELIKSMLLREEESKESRKFEHIVSDKIFPILAELELKNELELYQMLIKIGNKIQEQQKIRLLEGKKILGVGGKFSAGKSRFINSITNAELPEGQRPTTSIATYIVNSDNKNNVAITAYDKRIALDDEAVAALTHQFYEKYKIGFSAVIKNLVVYTPNFTYPDIAILDTPGYSKSDALKKNESSDAELAREQLKSVDYLIWLVDAVQGVITQRDLEFISSLNVSTKILIVFTKADCEIESNLEKKIGQAREALKGLNKEIYDVIAYNSMEQQTVIGEGVLEKFLDMINAAKAQEDEVLGQIKQMDAQLEQQLKEQMDELKRKMGELEKILIHTANVEHVSAVVREYAKCKALLEHLQKDKRKLQNCFKELIAIADKMGAVD